MGEDAKEVWDWLVLVYMAGDNNLGVDGEWGNAVKMDLEEMESSIPGSGMKVLALADMAGPNNTMLYDIEHNSTPGITSPDILLSEMDPSWTDEVDMSDPLTLESFLRYAFSKNTAQYSSMVLWDHGSGWYLRGAPDRTTPSRGFAIDQYSGNTQMYLDDFRDAFEHAATDLGGLHMDLIAFDTCFMGMAEVFYQVAPWFDIGVGSQDEQPFYGYNYSFIESITGYPVKTPGEFGNNMVDYFEKEYNITGQYAYSTIVVADLTVLKGDFLASLNSLSLHAMERMYIYEKMNGGAFHEIVSMSEQVGSENVDIGDLLHNMVVSDIDPALTDLAIDLEREYGRVVLDAWIKPDGRNPRGTGMCLYLPSRSMYYRSDYDGTKGFLSFTADSEWDELLREYRSPIERVRVGLSVSSMDGDGTMDDLTVTVENPQAGLVPIEGAKVFINGTFRDLTDKNGVLVVKDMAPGTYLVEAFNGTHIGAAWIKILNRAPVPVIEPSAPIAIEGIPLTLDATRSYDPDGDLVSFRWDLDDSNGLDDADSTLPYVTVTFAGEGNRTVRLSLNDSTRSTVADVVIQVENLVPSAWIQGPNDVVEDQPFNVSAEASSDTWPDSNSLQYRFSLDGMVGREWDRDDGWSLSIPDSGDHIVSVSVRDQDGAVNSTSMTVFVRNLPPTAGLHGPDQVKEDEWADFDATTSLDTPSDLANLTYDWEYSGSGDFEAAGPLLKARFHRSGTYQVRLTVSDGDEEHTAVGDVEVINLPPVALIQGPTDAFEDQRINLLAVNSTDTPHDRETLIFSWDTDGDSIFETSGETINVSFGTSGEHLVTLKVVDDDGAGSIAELRIKVKNLPPVPVLIAPGSADEDDQVTITLSNGLDTASDIPLLSVIVSVDGIETGGSIPLDISFSKEGPHTVAVRVTDDDGAEGADSVVIQVRNPPPVAIVQGIGPEVKEGSTQTAFGHMSFDTRSDNATLMFEWFLDGRPVGAGGRNLTFKAESKGEHILMLKVTDDEGASGVSSITFKVKDDLGLSTIVEVLLAPFFLLAVLMLLVLVIGSSIYVFGKVRTLPPPEAPDEMAEGEEGPSKPAPSKESEEAKEKIGEVPEPVSKSIPSKEVPPSHDAEGLPLEEGNRLSIPDAEVPDFEGDLPGVDIPEPPDIEHLEMPRMDNIS